MKPLTVLIIDDESQVRRVLSHFLRASSLAEFECVEAVDGHEGLQALEQHAVDIILLDWNMPRMAGDVFVHEMRKRREKRDIPIVMISSEGSLGKVEVAMEQLGVTDYLSKPFTVTELNARLEPIVRALEGRAAGARRRDSTGGAKRAAARWPVDVKRVAGIALLGVALLAAAVLGFQAMGDDAENTPFFWMGSVCTGTLVSLTSHEAVVDVSGSTMRFRVDAQTRFASRGLPGTPRPGSKVQIRYGNGDHPHARLIRLLGAPPADKGE